MNGQSKEETFGGLTARIFQHEYDHLEGITYTSKVSKLVLERSKGKMKSNLKKVQRMKTQFEALQKLQKEEKPIDPPKTPAIFSYSVE
jgi:peptide deformylase